MILSILTPSVPSRAEQVGKLCAQVELAIQVCGWARASQEVEHLVFSDNRQRRVGAKRQALLDMARGEYVAFVDDDDWIADQYVSKILGAILGIADCGLRIADCSKLGRSVGPDVVCFKQHTTYNGATGIVHFSGEHQVDEPFRPGGITRRRPWHVCAWKRELAIQGVFPEIDFGEDAAWVNQVAPLARTQVFVDEVLHYYRHDAGATLAPAPVR